MPKVSDFKEKKSTSKSSEKDNSQDLSDKVPKQSSSGAGAAVKKRRPGREDSIPSEAASEENMKVIDVEEGVRHSPEAEAEAEEHSQGADSSESASSESSSSATFSSFDEHKKIEIEFPGSELIRAKFPLPFNVAEAVANEWVADGDFSTVEIPNPIAEALVKNGLKRAKTVEKKVLESPLTEKVAMKALTYAMKAQAIYAKVKSNWGRR
jgi:hypothetical protein